MLQVVLKSLLTLKYKPLHGIVEMMTRNLLFHSGRETSLNPYRSVLISLYSATSISNDLTPHIDKPIWPLSSYAPAKHEPLLITGLDESPEELRVKAAAAVASGNINAYVSLLFTRVFDLICMQFVCS